jgi:hypothetical protein
MVPGRVDRESNSGLADDEPYQRSKTGDGYAGSAVTARCPGCTCLVSGTRGE